MKNANEVNIICSECHLNEGCRARVMRKQQSKSGTGLLINLTAREMSELRNVRKESF